MADTSCGAHLLALHGLGCERDGRWLFRDLTLAVAGGECVELTGPNGSGKTTLLRVIAGLYPDHAGTVAAAECLYVGHRPGVAAVLTAAENLEWYALLQDWTGVSGNDDAQTLSGAVNAALAHVGMTGYENVPCRQMSAGQQRRVALARLLLGGAPLWLLDEPLTALDADGQQVVRGLLDDHLARGGAAVCATHQALGVPATRRLDLGDAGAGAGTDDAP
jgi:heme exporter protein A